MYMKITGDKTLAATRKHKLHVKAGFRFSMPGSLYRHFLCDHIHVDEMIFIGELSVHLSFGDTTSYYTGTSLTV